ncbi:MAG: DUF427 domain-containing protein [Anaerolineae bacterium]|uniref:DUF427 domain-containing protein n=1 Tax=Promineifilum sp. TaxID=2664178 RepID=UPI001DCB10B2|nr:DUF427 domain-containing protein [Anaerolineales bacterium]MCB8935207.1 DUF427 domain-containing protein [Promineifilum sp.]MCO5179008.1 DUF427 domain-containing protein [Promineifilum sp.]MCW5846245.1 DUF427 domain-containing protein [Anaerolineae bacterium]
MKAIWNGVVLADSGDTKVVEGNYYFPPDSIRREYFRDSDRHTTCPWKGLASYYDVMVDGEVVRNAAWYYPEPKPAAAEIRDHVAFYGMVKIER